MAKHSADLDAMFAALAHPARRAIVQRLTQGAASVSELAGPLPMALPTVIEHLHALQTAGLVRSEKRGRVRTCRLDGAKLKAAQSWLDEQRALWEARTDSLEDFLQSRRDLDG